MSGKPLERKQLQQREVIGSPGVTRLCENSESCYHSELASDVLLRLPEHFRNTAEEAHKYVWDSCMWVAHH
jgi:hypothetical protein